MSIPCLVGRTKNNYYCENQVVLVQNNNNNIFLTLFCTSCQLLAGFPTFLFHASPEAFVEPAETTLVPLIFIHNALPAEPEQNQHAMTRVALQVKT